MASVDDGLIESAFFESSIFNPPVLNVYVFHFNILYDFLQDFDFVYANIFSN